MTAVLGFIKGAYSSLPEINGATLSGAIDVLVIQQEDGSLRSSPWYLRIGKYKVLRNPRDRVIKITVNEQLMDFEMKLSSTGDAYFCEASPSESSFALALGFAELPSSCRTRTSDQRKRT
jgi:phosphatidate phosphatase LPIN